MPKENLKNVFQQFMEMQDDEGQKNVSYWTLPNSDVQFDDDAKQIEYAADADEYAKLSVEAAKFAEAPKG